MSTNQAANAFKALSHDVRLRLFYAVGAAGEATATMLGHELGMAPAAISYHLSKLGEFGLLEEVPDGERDGRERWWRLAEGGLEIDEEDTEDGALLRFAILRHHLDRLRAYLTEHSPARTDDAGSEVAVSSDMVLRLDHDTADRFQSEVADLLRRYAAEPVEGGQQTFVMLQGVPYQ